MGVPVYTPIGWVDDTTDLSAANFQHMEQGILDAIAGLGSSKGVFKVGLTTAVTIGTSPTIVPYTDKTNFGGMDPDGWWDATNFRYKPQRAGYYIFLGAWRFAGTPAAGNGLWVSVYKNGSALLSVPPNLNLSGTANPGGPIASPPILFNGSTDYIDIRQNLNAGSLGLSVDASTNWISGHYIGA